MADVAPAAVAAPAGRGIGRSLLLTLPVALWALLMFSRALGTPGVACFSRRWASCSRRQGETVAAEKWYIQYRVST
jgi:hypothetical protein